MKASTLCAGSTLLVLGGFMSINLAGCGGGGGGGGGIGNPGATAGPQAITFTLRQLNNTASVGGTVSLSLTDGGAVIASGTANSSGVITLPTVPVGTYIVTFTTIDANGNVSTTVARSVSITRASGQNIRLIQNNTATGNYTVSGRVFANPNNETTPNCPPGTPAITDHFVISVIDLSSPDAPLVIKTISRDAQAANTPSASRGAYTVILPYRPAVFQVQVGQDDASGAQYAGISATTNFTTGTGSSTPTSPVNNVASVNICANNNGRIPRATPTAHPTPTVTVTFIPPRTGTPVATITTAPTATSTATSTPTATTAPTPTTVPTIG